MVQVACPASASGGILTALLLSKAVWNCHLACFLCSCIAVQPAFAAGMQRLPRHRRIVPRLLVAGVNCREVRDAPAASPSRQRFQGLGCMYMPGCVQAKAAAVWGCRSCRRSRRDQFQTSATIMRLPYATMRACTSRALWWCRSYRWSKWHVDQTSATSTRLPISHDACLHKPRFLAMQVLQKERVRYPSDIWALGVTLNELATGTFPYSDCTRDNPAAHTVLEMGYGRSADAALP